MKWVVAIVGVIFIGLILDLIYPNGKLNSLIKSIFGLIALVIILEPIFKFDYKINTDSFVDLQIVENLKETKDNSLVSKIYRSLKNNGIDNINVEIDSFLENNKYIIKNIYVDINNLVLLENFENINKYEVINKVIINITNIEKERIIIIDK